MSPFIDAALKWRERGFAVFPLAPRGKRPLGSLVRHGFLDASKDPAIIRDWWRRVPQANIGLRTGEGKFVVDLDDDDAVAWFVNACGRHGGAPSTLVVRTSRGLHLFFTCGDGVPTSAGRLAPGVDVRGEGAYVVGAPSVHPSGAVYTIEHDLAVARAPQWLIDLALPDENDCRTEIVKAPAASRLPPWHSENAKLRAIPGILSFVANARQGERNRITVWAACRFHEMVRSGLITQGLAEELLLQSAKRCGLNGMEILTTARSASRRA